MLLSEKKKKDVGDYTCSLQVKTHQGVLTTVFLNVLVFKNANEVVSDMKMWGNIKVMSPDHPCKPLKCILHCNWICLLI